MHETRGRVRVFDDLDFEGQQGVLIARKRHKPRAPFQLQKLRRRARRAESSRGFSKGGGGEEV